VWYPSRARALFLFFIKNLSFFNNVCLLRMLRIVKIQGRSLDPGRARSHTGIKRAESFIHSLYRIMRIELELTADEQAALSDALYARSLTLSEGYSKERAKIMNRVTVALLEQLDYPVAQWLRD
jgi:hypothetical protein